VTDLYLLALARRHGASLATLDRRIPAAARQRCGSIARHLTRPLTREMQRLT